MKLIVCLDDNNGMLFNSRRQSRDRKVCEQILELAASAPVWMNSYSAKLFTDMDSNVRVAEDFLDLADEDAHCFLENVDITPFLPKIDQIFVFRWNRIYPSDTVFPLDLEESGWKKTKVTEFAGKSHERITLEVYTV